MNKVLKFLLVAALVWMPVTMYAQDDIDYRAVLQQVCDEMNDELPAEVDEDMYFIAVTIEDDNLVLDFLTLDGTDFTEWSEDDISVYESMLEEGLSDDEDMAMLKYMCRMAGLGMALRIEDEFENTLTTYVDVDD